MEDQQATPGAPVAASAAPTGAPLEVPARGDSSSAQSSHSTSDTHGSIHISAPPFPAVNEALLSELVALYLPPNYDFEMLRTAKRLADESASRVALQLPEGLLAWGYQIAAILHRTVSCIQEVRLSSLRGLLALRGNHGAVLGGDHT